MPGEATVAKGCSVALTRRIWIWCSKKSSVEAQTRRVMENLKIVLGGIGLTLEHVAMARMYLTQFERDYAALNALWPSFFEAGKLPARTTVGVTALAVGALVEIDLVARRPG